nr:formyltransferase family protein [Thermus altitudinis]
MRVLSERIGARYVVAPHNSESTIALLQELKPDIGIIGGARILKKAVIDLFKIGILNLHPGLIPEVRGLDAMLWSIYHDIPLGVTAHLIDERVDAGRILIREEVPVYLDDTILDVSERIHDLQIMLIGDALSKAFRGEWTSLGDKVLGPPNRKMTPSQEAEALAKFEAYKGKYARSNKE